MWMAPPERKAPAPAASWPPVRRQVPPLPCPLVGEKTGCGWEISGLARFATSRAHRIRVPDGTPPGREIHLAHGATATSGGRNDKDAAAHPNAANPARTIWPAILRHLEPPQTAIHPASTVDEWIARPPEGYADAPGCATS